LWPSFFGDATDQAVRAWAGQLTMRQPLDITYVLTDILTDILRLFETTADGSAATGREGRLHRTATPGRISRARR
jgi:hypothetical protein